jgi:hypothetical protein
LAIVTAKGVNYDKEIEANLVNDMFNAPKSKIDKINKNNNNNKVPEKKFI